MQVQDVMTQHVISVEPTDAIARAIRLMLQERVSGLPVCEYCCKRGCNESCDRAHTESMHLLPVHSLPPRKNCYGCAAASMGGFLLGGHRHRIGSGRDRQFGGAAKRFTHPERARSGDQ